MLSRPGPAGVLAHAGDVTGFHDLVWAWSADPLLLGGLVVFTVLVARGQRPTPGHRPRLLAFAGGLTALAAALLSPLDALAGQLASAHMVQHLLLVQVAAPLLALSSPWGAVVRGLPAGLRRTLVRGTWRFGFGPRRLQRLRSPVGWLLAYVATLWLWHARWLYDAAVTNHALHVLEHASFLVTACLLWSAVLGAVRHRVSPGAGILAVFLLSLQGVVLAALLTFAREPWYRSYRDTTATWGLDPLADQQLAGAVMWIPGGVVNTAIGVGLAVQWLRQLEAPAPAEPRRSAAPVARGRLRGPAPAGRRLFAGRPAREGATPSEPLTGGAITYQPAGRQEHT
ncbi:MAG: cytochrome c oxidase assembly protein [Acidimicrobiales bacterium]